MQVLGAVSPDGREVEIVREHQPISVCVKPMPSARGNAERVREILFPLLGDAMYVRVISLRGVRLGFRVCGRMHTKTTHWQGVAELLGRFSALETLDLSDCQLPEDALFPIFVAVGKMASLRVLRLAGSQLKPKWIQYLGHLANRLTELDLRGCYPPDLVTDAPAHVLL